MSWDEVVRQDRALLGMEHTDSQDRQAWRGRLRSRPVYCRQDKTSNPFLKEKIGNVQRCISGEEETLDRMMMTMIDDDDDDDNDDDDDEVLYTCDTVEKCMAPLINITRQVNRMPT